MRKKLMEKGKSERKGPHLGTHIFRKKIPNVPYTRSTEFPPFLGVSLLLWSLKRREGLNCHGFLMARAGDTPCSSR